MRIELQQLETFSPRTLANKTEGIFLLLLNLEYTAPDVSARHFTVYHAKTGAILDPMSGKDAVIVDGDDRCKRNTHPKLGRKALNKAAMRPFYETFEMDPDKDKITMMSCYKATPIPSP